MTSITEQALRVARARVQTYRDQTGHGAEIEQLDAELALLDDAIAVVAAAVPSAAHHVQSPEYFRQICALTGMSTRALARTIGVDDGHYRGYMAGRRQWPYAVQFAVECLAAHAAKPR